VLWILLLLELEHKDLKAINSQVLMMISTASINGPRQSYFIIYNG
jgi:hypothetical protein